MKDEWVTAALSDDSVVVELLFRLKQSSSELPKASSSLFLPQGWGKHQPRSRPAISSRKDSAITTSPTRCSPNTPLSWSGGAASPSDGNCDGLSDSSRPSSDPSRSKGELTNISSVSTRSRNKKTFSELKEEESLLLKERADLTRELSSLQDKLHQQRATSQNLKRIKFDLTTLQQSKSEKVGTLGDPMTEEASTSNAHSHLGETRQVKDENFASVSSCRDEKVVETPQQRRCFVLPDLNVMPAELEGFDSSER